LLFGQLLKFRGEKHSGIVDEDIQAPEFLFRGGEQRGHILPFRDISLDCHCASPDRRDLRDDFVRIAP